MSLAIAFEFEKDTVPAVFQTKKGFQDADSRIIHHDVLNSHASDLDSNTDIAFSP